MTTFIAAIVASAWLIFANIEPFQINGNFIRQIILLFCSIIYVTRIAIMAFIFFKRKLVWLEAITIAILMPIILFALAYVGGKQPQPINLIDIIGIILCLFGSYLNTWSEYTRHLWKQNPTNKDRLYTKGMFKYSMHINYFGDVLLFTGWTLITQSTMMLLIPLKLKSQMNERGRKNERKTVKNTGKCSCQSSLADANGCNCTDFDLWFPGRTSRGYAALG